MPVYDIDMTGIAADICGLRHGRLTDADETRHRRRVACDSRAIVELGAVALDQTWPQLKRRLVSNQIATPSIVIVGQQRIDRHIHARRIAVKLFTVGEGKFGAFGNRVNEFRTQRIHRVEVKMFEQGKLL